MFSVLPSILPTFISINATRMQSSIMHHAALGLDDETIEKMEDNANKEKVFSFLKKKWNVGVTADYISNATGIKKSSVMGLLTFFQKDGKVIKFIEKVTDEYGNVHQITLYKLK